MPWLLERIDYTWERHSGYQHYNTSVRPSELVKDHIYGCFISDRTGILLRHEIGIDRIMWEGDYPHSDSQFPDRASVPWRRSRTCRTRTCARSSRRTPAGSSASRASRLK